MTKAIGYVRVSTVEQAEHGYSLDDQRASIEAYCSSRQWDMVEIVGDHGLSGADSDRPGLAAARSSLLEGSADALVVTKLDRLSRSASLMLSVTEELEAAGVSIVSITEAIDTSTPAGKLFRTVLAGVAEFEKELITDRLVAGKRAKQAKLGAGAYIGGPTVPFGYRANGDVLERHPDEWPVAARILGERRSGSTLQAIADRLNKESFRGKRGGKWTPGTLSRLLRSLNRLQRNESL